MFDLTSLFVTWGQKEGGIYLGPWNHDFFFYIYSAKVGTSLGEHRLSYSTFLPLGRPNWREKLKFIQFDLVNI